MKHGTLAGYNYHACRCDLCRAARTEYQRHYKSTGHQPWSATHPELQAWRDAKRRLTDPKNSHWHHYGGRGIRMAPEWLDDYPAFLAHIGPRPGPEYSLDRIDPDGNYEPGNVRWATRSQQRRNRSRSAPSSKQVAQPAEVAGE